MVEESAAFTFADNSMIPQVMGAGDANLRQLEQGFGVRLSARGNKIAITGAPAMVQATQTALSMMVERIQKSHEITESELRVMIQILSDAHQNDGSMYETKIDSPKVNGETLFSKDDAEAQLADSGKASIRTPRKNVRAYTPGQAAYIRALMKNEMVFASGPAGTGKTFIAVAAAVHMFSEGKVDRIILSRPAVEAGESLGFLPGDLKDKVDPYLRPLYDSLHDLFPTEKVAKFMETGQIEVAPLAYMRGRTLRNAFVILDEGQNTTPVQMKMFLTRLGEGSRMVITGDLSQTDLPKGMKSGFRDALEKLEGVPEVVIMELAGSDVVRHPLTTKIIQAYDKHENFEKWKTSKPTS